MKLIDKEKVVDEIERRIDRNNEKAATYSSNSEHDYLYKVKEAVYKNLLSFINTIEVKKVDLEKEYEEYVVDDPIWGNFITNDTMGMELAKHFFELGLKANQEYNVIGTIEREVKIDAGGYPCIDCYIEFYDYDKDIPLAQEGDKVKIIVVKGE